MNKIYKSFLDEALRGGVYTGSLRDLVMILSDQDNVLSVRVVNVYKGETYVEVMKNLPHTILCSTYQQIGGIQATERWVAVEGGGFLKEAIKPQVYSYD